MHRYSGLDNAGFQQPPILPPPTKLQTVIWNLSKRADNASRLVQPETFDMLFNLLSQDKEEGDVLRRIVSCIQNLAAMSRYGTARHFSVFFYPGNKGGRRSDVLVSSYPYNTKTIKSGLA